jgi:adenine-specific DNA-methyltransferase
VGNTGLRPIRGDIRPGFVYERVLRVTLRSIANNAENDVIRELYQAELEPLRAQLNAALGVAWEEWQVPRTLIFHIDPHPDPLPQAGEGARAASPRPRTREGEGPVTQQREGEGRATALHALWWELRIARQKEIDASIAAKADVEYLYHSAYTLSTCRLAIFGMLPPRTLWLHRFSGEHKEEQAVAMRHRQ